MAANPSNKCRPAYEYVRKTYPHMGPKENEIWTKFLLTTKMCFVRVDYDVRVGPGYDPGPTFDETIRRMAIALTQLRIDAVGETEHEVWIFEVKPRAGRSALGQLSAYGYWYVRQYHPAKPVRLAVVCESVDPNMPPVYAERGIEIFKV